VQDLSKESGGRPLLPQQLAQAITVCQALADVVGASGGGATTGRQGAAAGSTRTGSEAQSQQVLPYDMLLVPDDEGVLRPAADLAFDDAPWLDAPTAGKRW
jgi:hypothetical protein